jgi:hypothetical protein
MWTDERLTPGAVVELADRLPLHPHLRPGTRGRVVRTLGYWALVEVIFDGEPRPAVVKARHLRHAPAVHPHAKETPPC